MTYPDDILKAAREAASRIAQDGWLIFVDGKDVIARPDDNHLMVMEEHIAEKLMAERQRCATEARNVAERFLDADEPTQAKGAELAMNAILGQQETAHAQP